MASSSLTFQIVVVVVVAVCECVAFFILPFLNFVFKGRERWEGRT